MPQIRRLRAGWTSLVVPKQWSRKLVLDSPDSYPYSVRTPINYYYYLKNTTALYVARASILHGFRMSLFHVALTAGLAFAASDQPVAIIVEGVAAAWPEPRPMVNGPGVSPVLP